MKNNIIYSSKFRELIYPYRLSIINYQIGTLVEISIQNIVPLLEACLIDEVIYHQNMKTFFAISLMYLALYIGYSINFVLVLCTQQNTDNTFVMNIKKRLFKTIIFSRPDILDNIKTGDNVNLINQDANELFLIIRKNIIRFTNEFILFFIAWLFVFLMNWKIGIIMLIVIPSSVMGVSYFGKKSNQISNSYKTRYSNFITWLLEIISGMSEIKLLGAKKNTTKLFKTQIKDLMKLKNSQNTNIVYSQIITNLIQLIGDIILYTASVIFIIKGEISIGSFIAFISYFESSKLSLRNIMDYIIEFQYRKVSVERVINKLNDESEEYQGDLTDNLESYNISYKNVSFGYSQDKKVLQNLFLDIAENEVVSIVGESGTGKSTLIKLLLNLYQPSEGLITIGNYNVKDFNLNSLRSFVGLVQQDINIFPGTIRYNLNFGDNSYSDDEIWEACQKAKISDVIKNLPMKLNSIIGESGIDLSEGQKQRLILARIYLKNTRIIVLDEATSALDLEVEKEILDIWRELANSGKTLIIIAHRLSTILSSNKIAVLSNGKIVACDKHDNLIKESEEYRKIFQSQIF